MAKITRKVSIPATSVSREFLKELGEIIESEANERLVLHETSAEKLKRPPLYSIKYILETEDGEVSYESANEILQSSFLPNKINSLLVTVNHYQEEYVDISIDISEPLVLFGFTQPKNYRLSSSNEGRLLVIDRKLGSLFKKNRNAYQSFLFPIKSHIVLAVVSLVTAATLAYSVYSEIRNFFPAYSDLFVWFAFVAYYSISMTCLKWLYPFYEFVLSPRSPFRRALMYLIWAVPFGLLVNGLSIFLLD